MLVARNNRILGCPDCKAIKRLVAIIAHPLEPVFVAHSRLLGQPRLLVSPREPLEVQQSVLISLVGRGQKIFIVQLYEVLRAAAEPLKVEPRAAVSPVAQRERHDDKPDYCWRYLGKIEQPVLLLASTNNIVAERLCLVQEDRPISEAAHSHRCVHKERHNCEDA